eukprot:10260209-Ditylum_brightwellii.AAC.1
MMKSSIFFTPKDKEIVTQQRKFYTSRAAESLKGETDVNVGADDLPLIIQTKGVPIHLYATDLAADALQQLIILAESPLPTDYVCAMPDAHLGKG